MSYRPAPEFRDLYAAFTSDPESIGAHLNAQMGVRASDDPMLVVTGSDLVIFPGGARPPLIESFRNSTRGFVELTAISHLGVALPYIAELYRNGFASWREDAEQLAARIEAARAVNTLEYWTNTVAVAAWRGHERKIVALVDYACEVTLRFLDRMLADPDEYNMARLRAEFLDPAASSDVPVPMNDMMVATFALVFLDTGHRVIGWLQEQALDWERVMVLLCGKAGRPTAGLTWQSNSMCHLLWRASKARLVPERLYIAPHAPGLVLPDLETAEGAAQVEKQFRQIWYSTRATVEMGGLMYEGYPAFHRSIEAAPVIDTTTSSLSALPGIASADDRRGFVTLLRYVMEDPGQQLANSSAHYIIDQLCAHGNDPSRVPIPGFTGVDYPPGSAGR